MTGSFCLLVKMPWQSAAGLISKLYKHVRALLLLVSKTVFDPGFGFQRVEACFREMLVLKKKKNPNPSFRGCCPSARFNRDSCDVPMHWKGQLQR